MALPSKVVDQLSRAPARTPGWSSRVLLFSATFFILSLVIFLGIEFGYKPFLEGQVKSLDREISDFSKQVPGHQQDELISFYSQLDNLSTLLAQQGMPSKVFKWLEDNTNVNAQLISVAYNGLTHTVTVTGQARSITNLGEQLNRFQHQPELRTTQLSQLSLDSKSGGWNFSMVLAFDPHFFAADPISVDQSSLDTTSELPASTPVVASSSVTSTITTSSSTTLPQ